MHQGYAPGICTRDMHQGYPPGTADCRPQSTKNTVKICISMQVCREESILQTSSCRLHTADCRAPKKGHQHAFHFRFLLKSRFCRLAFADCRLQTGESNDKIIFRRRREQKLHRKMLQNVPGQLFKCNSLSGNLNLGRGKFTS